MYDILEKAKTIDTVKRPVVARGWWVKWREGVRIGRKQIFRAGKSFCVVL